MCAYTLSHLHHPSPHTNILASLVKGEVLSPEKIRATTGGIAAPTLPKPHYPLAFCNANICMRRYAFASAPSFASHQHPCLHCQRCGAVALKNSGDYRRDCRTNPLHPHNPLKTPSPLIKTHHHSPFSPRVSPQLLLRFPHRQPRRRPTRNRICSSARRSAPLCLASPAFQPF